MDGQTSGDEYGDRHEEVNRDRSARLGRIVSSAAVHGDGAAWWLTTAGEFFAAGGPTLQERCRRLEVEARRLRDEADATGERGRRRRARIAARLAQIGDVLDETVREADELVRFARAAQEAVEVAAAAVRDDGAACFRCGSVPRRRVYLVDPCVVDGDGRRLVFFCAGHDGCGVDGCDREPVAWRVDAGRIGLRCDAHRDGDVDRVAAAVEDASAVDGILFDDLSAAGGGVLLAEEGAQPFDLGQQPRRVVAQRGDAAGVVLGGEGGDHPRSPAGGEVAVDDAPAADEVVGSGMPRGGGGGGVQACADLLDTVGAGVVVHRGVLSATVTCSPARRRAARCALVGRSTGSIRS